MRPASSTRARDLSRRLRQCGILTLIGVGGHPIHTIDGAMMTARQTDQIETGHHETWMESDVRLDTGMIIGRTRIWTDREWSTVVGAVRVVAVDDVGNVLGFTGERTIRVGVRRLPTADRTVNWSSALFADSLDGVARLDVVHFRPPRRNVVDRVIEGA